MTTKTRPACIKPCSICGDLRGGRSKHVCKHWGGIGIGYVQDDEPRGDDTREHWDTDTAACTYEGCKEARSGANRG